MQDYLENDWRQSACMLATLLTKNAGQVLVINTLSINYIKYSSNMPKQVICFILK